jgi:hypothetical protein
MANMCFAETLVGEVMGMETVLGTMVFMPFNENRFGFQRINVKIKDG